MKHKLYIATFLLFIALIINSIVRLKFTALLTVIVNISTFVDGRIVTAKSSKLIISLDYNTALFKIRLDKSSLKTNVDSLNTFFSKLKGEFIELKGKMGIDFIETKSHPMQNFKVGMTLVFYA